MGNCCGTRIVRLETEKWQPDGELIKVCTPDGLQPILALAVYEPTLDEWTFTDGITGDTIVPGTDFITDCEETVLPLDTCFLPDQYAITWAWNGSGNIRSYDPVSQTWTNHGNTSPGGYALAFKNDAISPTLFFQTAGNLYKASPDDPVGTFTLVGPTGANAGATSSYPCFDFDPTGRLLVGILTGSRVASIDPATGVSTNLGQLIDTRTGNPGSYSPGDWFFDPSGNWFLMASDNAFDGLTHLFQIDTVSLEVTKVSNTGAPQNGTGASWLAAGRSLLSTSSGIVYEYNEFSDTWSVFSNAGATLNDLAAQWIIPEAIRVTGYIDISSGACEPTLYELVTDESGAAVCRPFSATLTGKFGPCEPEPNPFVTDPFSPTQGSSGCDSCPDEVWHKGCSDAGETLYRFSYDPTGNRSIQYLYGTLSDPITVAPPGFSYYSCAAQPDMEIIAVPFCNLDTGGTVVYRQDSDGTITWFDETGTIPEPANVTPGECPVNDPTVVSLDTEICLSGSPAIRRITENYIFDGDGQLQLQTVRTVYFDSSGVIWDSDVDPAAAEPTDWYLGACVLTYADYRFEKLCEKDDRKLLLIDSGGSFAELSFFDESLTPIAIPVPSAGSGADINNFILYAVTQGDDLLAVNVNTRTTLYQIPLFTNDGSVLGTSAAAFDHALGVLAYYDYPTSSLYQVNVATAEVSFLAGPFTGVVSSGSSLAIDITTGRYLVTGSAGRVYEIDPTGANLAATLIVDTNVDANGMTFDDSGTLYIGYSNGTAANAGEITCYPDFFANSGSIQTTLVEDWGPGVNSLAYYNIKAQRPSCFFRKYGVSANGDIDYLSDHYVSDGSERTVAGAVDCCSCTN
jgi:hypothetical protein